MADDATPPRADALPPALRAPGWAEPGRILRITLVLVALTLLVGSWGLALPVSACLLAAAWASNANPTSPRAERIAMAGIPIYVVIAIVEGLLLKTHEIGDTWAIIQNAHRVFVLAGVPGVTFAVACTIAAYSTRRAYREPSLDAAERVLAECGATLAVGGTVAAFLHLTFRSIPATLLDVAVGLIFLVVVAMRDVARVRWLRSLYAAGSAGRDGLVLADADGEHATLPMLTRGRGAIRRDRILKRETGAPSDYRSASRAGAVAWCPTAVDAATSPPLARIAIVLLAFGLVGIVWGAVALDPKEMLRFLR